MRRWRLFDYFGDVAVKRLRAVETDLATSNQDEFTGSAALRRLLGSDDRRRITARFVRLGQEQAAVTEDGIISWYDAR
jgi:hypothetical protein